MREFIIKAWKFLNAVLAVIFLYMIVDAWLEILYFKRTEKYYYYIATLFIIPLFTCLIVVLDWDLDNRKG